jgi:hypothetical protein
MTDRPIAPQLRKHLADGTPDYMALGPVARRARKSLADGTADNATSGPVGSRRQKSLADCVTDDMTDRPVVRLPWRNLTSLARGIATAGSRLGCRAAGWVVQHAGWRARGEVAPRRGRSVVFQSPRRVKSGFLSTSREIPDGDIGHGSPAFVVE